MSENLKVETSITGTNGGFHVYVAVPGGRKVAAVWGDAEKRFDRAYLFAAAPDMFEALYQAETVMMIVEPRSHTAEYLAALKAATAALAKALGPVR